MMFRLFENALDPTEKPAETQPPASLVAFYWHFARQAKGLFAALFVTGLMVALLDAAIPAFMGKVVTLVTSAKPDFTSAASSKVRSRPICPSCSPPNSRWPSISKLRRLSASRCRRP